MQTKDSPCRAGGTGSNPCQPRESNKHRNLIGIKPGAKPKSSHRVNVADDRDHDLTPSHCVGRRLHSVDVQPAGNRIDHVLVINGLPAARFDDLRKAIAARQLLVDQADDRGSGGLKCKSVLHLSPGRVTEGKGCRV